MVELIIVVIMVYFLIGFILGFIMEVFINYEQSPESAVRGIWWWSLLWIVFIVVWVILFINDVLKHIIERMHHKGGQDEE